MSTFYKKHANENDPPKEGEVASLYSKWGAKTIAEGWTSVPNALLKRAGQLGLDTGELLTLIYLMRFWWTADSMPFPSISKTAIEMGVSKKTLDKKFASLIEKGLLEAIVVKDKPTKYSLQGLVRALEIGVAPIGSENDIYY